MSVSYVHLLAEIDPDDRLRFGGKATGLARMARLGIPVPPAFVINTDGWRAFRAEGQLPAALCAEVETGIAALEQATARGFGGDAQRLPLLVSVRSGAQVSMPGMMDTVLNLGINAQSAYTLARDTGHLEFALDTWQRFWRMFAEIVLGLDGDALIQHLAAEMDAVRNQPTPAIWQVLENAVLAAIRAEGEDISADPRWQLHRAIEAVFASWDSRRARAYRAHHQIDDKLGTAVTVQAMVFGNLDAHSGSGVAFTRHPGTGARALYGEFVCGQQGEDLVSGAATPVPITESGAMRAQHLHELGTYGKQLEAIYRDAVDIEFTVEGEHLYLLQVRPAKRTAQAAAVIAVDLVDEGILTPQEAVQRVSVEQVRALCRPVFDQALLDTTPVLARGIAASPGHASGKVMLDADRAVACANADEPVVLLRPTTSPQDIRGMLAATAIITACGGALSHAAVVARALDKPCVVGCGAIEIDSGSRYFAIGGQIFAEGTTVSVDGINGHVYLGPLPLVAKATADAYIERLNGWADGAFEYRGMAGKG